MFSGLLLGFGLALVVALISWRWGVLSTSGALATAGVGTIIFGLAGWTWSAAVLFFFFSSSFLSKLGQVQKIQIRDIFQKSEKRDWAQVLANGLVPALCILFSHVIPSPDWYLFYLAALSSATADTWATELGVLSRAVPILLTTGQRVPVGTSGGITWAGTLASLAGALALSLIGVFLFPAYQVPVRSALTLTIVGSVAAHFDSLLGATIQAQYICPACKKRTERKRHCAVRTERISGYFWMNNDWVNFISSLFAAGLTFLLIKE